METSERYNSVPVKDNCALFAPIPILSGPGCPTVSFKFFPCRPLLPWQQILDKIDYNSAPVKDNCTLFSPTLYFRARAMQWCHVNFSLKTPVVMATNRFYSKTKLAAGSQER